jgi:hypothetical protein
MPTQCWLGAAPALDAPGIMRWGRGAELWYNSQSLLFNEITELVDPVYPGLPARAHGEMNIMMLG